MVRQGAIRVPTGAEHRRQHVPGRFYADHGRRRRARYDLVITGNTATQADPLIDFESTPTNLTASGNTPNTCSGC